MSFGAWGERQKSDWKPGTPTETFLTSNGFTGHDQLDNHNLVHMGGRVYDPNLGRFLSADLIVQSPYNPQSYNRYSYTFNNPSSFTDPTGYGCTTHYFHTYYNDPYGNKIFMGDTTQTTCDNNAYNQADHNNGVEDFQLPELKLSDYLDYASQQQAITGTLEPIYGNSFAGTACGVLSICLRDGVQEDADVAAAEKVIGAPTLLAGGLATPSPAGKARAVVRISEALFIVKAGSVNFVNKVGKFYPNIPDLRTGKPIVFPLGELNRVSKESRVPWTAKERGEFIREWYKRGYSTPRGGWAEYDIHHIKPKEFGGTNDFWNLTPVQRTTHAKEFNSFWGGM